MWLNCVSSLELALSSYLKMAEVELGRENEGTHLHHPCCKIKDWIHRKIMLMFTYWSDQCTRWRTALLLDRFSLHFFGSYFIGTPSFLFFWSYFFGMPSFLSSSLWVKLLWHVIFPLFFQMERYYHSKILEHLFYGMREHLCIRMNEKSKLSISLKSLKIW